MDASILVVDDEAAIQESLRAFLGGEGYRVVTTGCGRDALARLEAQAFDVVVADIVLPGLGGLELLERSRALSPEAAIIVVTAHATVRSAVAALRRGAADFFEKPLRLEELGWCVRRLLGRRRRARVAPPSRPALAAPPVAELVGSSPAMRGVREQIARCAPTASTVLLTGESGTGKELAARALHAASPRRDRPFVPVNCGAIPETLLESQLFGHVRGAFTGAVHANPGLFVVADGGTLFLDEVGDLPGPLQVKLLRVLEDKQVWAVGATRPVAVDVRVVASTNRELSREVEAGRFRADLFYRLDVMRLTLPPLRERREDITLLADRCVRRLGVELGRGVPGIEPEALRALTSHAWRGNVRELENVLERALALGDGQRVTLEDLPPEVAGAPPAASASLRDAVRAFERRHIRDVLARTRRDKRAAARLLGISLASLYRKLGGDGKEAVAGGE